MSLLESELSDVARHRRLRDDAARVRKCIDQLELRTDALSRHDTRNETLPVVLRERTNALHPPRIFMQVSVSRPRETTNPMLRKLLWSALYGGFGAVATVVSRRGAAKVWRTLTGEEPPTKK